MYCIMTFRSTTNLVFSGYNGAEQLWSSGVPATAKSQRLSGTHYSGVSADADVNEPTALPAV